MGWRAHRSARASRAKARRMRPGARVRRRPRLPLRSSQVHRRPWRHARVQGVQGVCHGGRRLHGAPGAAAFAPGCETPLPLSPGCATHSLALCSSPRMSPHLAKVRRTLSLGCATPSARLDGDGRTVQRDAPARLGARPAQQRRRAGLRPTAAGPHKLPVVPGVYHLFGPGDHGVLYGAGELRPGLGRHPDHVQRSVCGRAAADAEPVRHPAHCDGNVERCQPSRLDMPRGRLHAAAAAQPVRPAAAAADQSVRPAAASGWWCLLGSRSSDPGRCLHDPVRRR